MQSWQALIHALQASEQSLQTVLQSASELPPPQASAQALFFSTAFSQALMQALQASLHAAFFQFAMCSRQA